MKKLGGVKKLFFYVRRKKFVLFGLCILSIIAALFQLLPVQVLGLLVDTLNSEKLGVIEKIIQIFIGDSPVKIILCFGIIYISSKILSNVYGFLVSQFNNDITENVRKDIFKSTVLRENVAEEKDISGDIVTRSVGDVEAITRVIAGPLNGFLQNILMCIISLVFLGMWNIKAVIVTVFFSALIYILSAKISERNKELGVEERNIVQKISLKFTDVLNNIFLIKSYQTENTEIDNLCEESISIFKCRTRLAKCMASYWIKVSLCNVFGIILVLLIILQEIQRGNCSVGEIIVAYTYLETIFSGMISVSRYKTDIFNSNASLERVFELIDHQSDNRPENISENFNVINEFKLSHLSIGYDQKTVVSDINISLKKGEFLAITGSSGSGKSTILNGILGFARIMDGKIYLNEKDVTEDFNILRSCIRVCFQNSYLFSNSLAYNLEYDASGKPDMHLFDKIGIAQIIKVKGLDYTLESKTQSLSGGEKRRIALARTLNKNVPIYFFDEPTAELDKENRRFVINTLQSLRGKAIIIVVTHDEDLMDIADKIYNVK